MSNNILKSLSGKEELTLESDGSLFPKAAATRSPPFQLSEELASSPGPWGHKVDSELLSHRSSISSSEAQALLIGIEP